MTKEQAFRKGKEDARAGLERNPPAGKELAENYEAGYALIEHRMKNQ